MRNHDLRREFRWLVELQDSLGGVSDEFIDEEQRIEEARAGPQKRLEVLVFTKEIAGNRYAVTNAGYCLHQLSGRCVRIVVLVNPANRVMQNVQVKQEVVSHALCSLL